MRPDAPALPSSLRRDLTPALDGAGAGGGAGAEQAPADTHAVDASVTRQGWLYKLSTTAVMPHWTRRWFVLCGGSLYYFNSASVTTEPTLFAHLRDVEVHAQPPQAPGRGAPRQQICFALGPRRAAGGSVAGSVASGSCGGSFSASRGRTAANAGGGGGGGARLDPLHRPLSEGDAGSLGGAISPAASAASGPGSSASGQSDPSAARARTPVRGGARKKRPGSGQSTPPRAPPAPPTLFLAADTVDGKYGWVRQLEAARALPPCPVLSLKTALERAARQRNVDVNLLAASLGEAEAEAEGLRGALDEARAEAEALRAAVQYKDAQLWTLSQAIDSALPAPMRMLRRWLAPRVVDDAPVARGAGPWQLWRFGGGGGGGGSGGLGRMGTGTRRSRLDRLSRQDLGLPDDAAHPAHLAHPEHGSFWNPARAGAAGEVSGVPLSFHKSPLMYVGMSGWLTKQSKGGYTTNWNRRWFVLIEGSLYYTSSPVRAARGARGGRARGAATRAEPRAARARACARGGCGRRLRAGDGRRAEAVLPPAAVPAPPLRRGGQGARLRAVDAARRRRGARRAAAAACRFGHRSI